MAPKKKPGDIDLTEAQRRASDGSVKIEQSHWPLEVSAGLRDWLIHGDTGTLTIPTSKITRKLN